MSQATRPEKDITMQTLFAIATVIVGLFTLLYVQGFPFAVETLNKLVHMMF